ARERLARLRQAVRAGVRGLRARLLPHRPDALQSRAGRGHRARERPHVRGRRHRYRAPRAQLRGRLVSGEIAIIVSDAPGWHGAQLKRALRARGWRARYVSLRACRFDATQGAGVVLPGFGRRLPDGVLVRGIPGGTFEEVTFYLGMLHALRALGVPVYNDARAIERSVDKSTTSFLLRHHGIPTPPAWALTDPAAARALLIAETAHGHELVLKPLFGARGRGLQR